MWFAFAAVAQSQDYFPLQVGNQWVYRVNWAGQTGNVVVEVTKEATINDQLYAQVRGFEEGPVWLRMSPEGTLYRYNSSSGLEEVWAVFATKEGQTYRTSITPCNSTARVESKTATASLPASDFYGLLEITYPRGNCSDAGLLRELYAPYIGLIERTSDTIAGPRVLRLLYSRTGAITVLSQPETSFGLSITKDDAFLTARLTLRNTAAKPLELNFSSSQRYDFVIRNLKGEQVYQWSATRSFAQVMGSEVVEQGERNWVEQIPLKDNQGTLLPPGFYAVEAYLTHSAVPRYSASVGFEIQPALKP